MSAPTAQKLDVFKVALDGVHNIEASAGTGKTWNICLLYLRLVLERGLEAGQILVMSFTNAAAAELKSRIYARLNDFMAQLQNPVAGKPDPALAQLHQSLRAQGLDDALLLQRSLQARSAFDEAAIFTMHGFCHRLLAEIPFDAAEPLRFTLEGNNHDICLEYSRDYWRRHVFTLDAARLQALQPCFDHYHDSPESWAKALQKVLSAPLDMRLWPEHATLPADHFEQAQTLFSQAWQNAVSRWPGASQALEKALDQFDQRSFSAVKFQQAAQYWQRIVSLPAAPSLLPVSEEKRLIFFCARYQEEKLNKGKRLPEHPFFTAASELLSAHEAVLQAAHMLRIQLVHDMIESGQHIVAAEKRRQRRLSFDDLLRLTQQAVAADQDFANTIRSRYPAALIDEFQDTDPLQFAIFKRIYLQADTNASSLFLVGDPKQAIYRFRGADLPTYLRARAAATKRHTLPDNQRADKALIEALNLLFGRNPQAFIEPGLTYEAVQYGVKPRTPFADNSGGSEAALQILAANADGLGVDAQRALSAQHCAAEIARLLAAAEHIRIGGQALRPGQIAVLVNRHEDGRLMRRVLAGFGIDSMELSRTSVYASDEAKDLRQILQAIIDPRPQAIAAALASRLHGHDCERLHAWRNTPEAVSASMEHFRHWQWLWRSHGIAAMLRHWLQDSAVAERLLQLEGGERRLTNVIHLSELLAAAQNTCPGAEALLRHYENLCEQPGDEDVELLRLESDRDLVRIVTIHSAKGLEYPLVFCPFVWDQKNSRRSKQLASHYYDPDRECNVFDFRPDENPCERERHLAELAEQMRLLYVALTRAAHRCYLFMITGSASNPAAVLHWPVNTDTPIADWPPRVLKGNRNQLQAQLEQDWQQLAAAGAHCIALRTLAAPPPMPSVSQPPASAHRASAQPLQAASAPSALQPGWRNTSFTHLYRGATQPPAHITPEHDSASLLATANTPATSEAAAAPRRDDILDFPRGALAGECIHQVFEHYFDAVRDHARPPASEDCAAIIERALQLAPPTSRTLHTPEKQYRAMLHNMLNDVLAADLLPEAGGLRLQAIRQFLPEAAFELPALLSSARLNAWFASHRAHYPIAPLPEAGQAPLPSRLKGFIDLLFEHDGRYYLLDWKSNYLGGSIEDYNPTALAQAMAAHGYHLQHLIYGMALERHLRALLPDYDFERHFGGVFYLFVRAVRPAANAAAATNGVWFHRPAADTLSSFNQLFKPASLP